MHRNGLAQLALRRAHVHDHLPLAGTVECLDGHQRQDIDRHGKHHEVGLVHPLLEGDHAVGQPQPEGFGGVFGRPFDSEDLFGEGVVAQGQGKRAADKAQSCDHDFHRFSPVFRP